MLSIFRQSEKAKPEKLNLFTRIYLIRLEAIIILYFGKE